MNTVQENLPDIKWGNNGLVVAIAQDAYSGQILMQAWMNMEALQKTLADGYATFWSRSRKSIWRKGETSGHFLKLVDIYIDCDADCILLQVESVAKIACHTGTVSCFNEKLDPANGTISEQAAGPQQSMLTRLEKKIKEQAGADPKMSYTASLTAAGTKAVQRKINEESQELIQASQNEGNQRLIEETADLWYHILVLLNQHGVSVEQVFQELKKRTTQSGLQEKSSRNQVKAK